MRSILALLLSLILALASQSEAVARAEMAGATDQTLCGSFGVTSVTLDASGHRIAPHPCTHCIAAGVVAYLARPALLQAAPLTRGLRLTPAQTAQTALRRALAPTARGPPGPLV
ncbi:hypothetical protein GC209_00100 [bacterium]|nr:hypothetical protein [bacterium]